MIAIFISKKLAIFIVKPIHDLSSAIQEFKLGTKLVKVQEKTNEDEINVLAKSFNKMIDTITSQHSDIMNSKHLIEERNHFIEAMMSELSAGVIVLNNQLNIEMSNLSALRILNIDIDETIINKNYKDILPEFIHIIDDIFANHSSEIISSNISIIRGEKSDKFTF